MYAQHFIIRTHANESYSIPDTLFHQNSQELRECFLIKAFRRDFILRITFLIGYTTSECTKTRRNLSLKNRSYISIARFACHRPYPSACGLTHHPTNAISNSPSFGLRMMPINPYFSNMQNPSISEPYSANSPHKMGRRKRLVYLLGRHQLSIDITNLYKKPYYIMSIVKVKYILIIIKE